jgi:hypothetical protein
MTDTITYQETDLSSWITLHLYEYTNREEFHAMAIYLLLVARLRFKQPPQQPALKRPQFTFFPSFTPKQNKQNYSYRLLQGLDFYTLADGKAKVFPELGVMIQPPKWIWFWSF